MSKAYELVIVTKVAVEAESKDMAFEILLDVERAIGDVIDSQGYFLARGKGEVIKEVLKNEEGYYCIDDSYGEIL